MLVETTTRGPRREPESQDSTPTAQPWSSSGYGSYLAGMQEITTSSPWGKV
jgi:hypothetical protein